MNSKSLAISALLATLATAQNTPPPIPIELRARFGFTGPLVQKVSYGIGSLKIGDVDGDGRLEAVTFDSRRAQIVVVSVDNAATSKLTIPTGGQIADFELGDFAGNGQAQIVIVDNRGRMSVRKMDGSAATRPFELGLPTRGLNLVAADINNDGKHDIVAYAGGKMRVVMQVAGEAKLTPIEPTENNLYSVNLIDLDGDGNLDLTCIVSGDGMNLRMRLGNGDGTFDDWVTGPASPSVGVNGARKIVVADMDGQGRLDLIAARDNGLIHVHLEQGFLLPNPSYGPPSVRGAGSNLGAVYAGDLNGDGLNDVVSFHPVNNSGSVHVRVHFNDPSNPGTLVAPPAGVAASISLGTWPTSCAMADWDSDGDLDLVISASNELRYLLNDGTGNLVQAAPIPLSGMSATFSVGAGDVNGDGRTDLLAAAYNSIVIALQPVGGVPTGGLQYPGAGNTNFLLRPFLGDVDGDGDGDLLLRD